MPHLMRGQLSIETLIIAAALLAFLAFTLPSIGKVFDSLREHSVRSSQQAAFDQIFYKTREASALGAGTRFTFTASFAADSTELYFDSQKGMLRIDYWFAGKNNSLQANLSSTVYAARSNLSSGNYELQLYNNGSGVVLSQHLQ